MNEVFNMRRFLMYSRLRFSGAPVFFFTPLFVAGIAILLIMSDMVFEGMNGVALSTFQMLVGFVGFFVFVILYASRTFSDFHRRDRGFMLAGVPASGLEKYLYGMLQSTLVFAVLYAIAYIVSVLMVGGYNLVVDAGPGTGSWDKPLMLASLMKDFRNDFIYANPFYPIMYIQLVLVVSAVFAAGSVFFRRFGFLFSALVFLLYFWIVANILTLSYGAAGSYNGNHFGNAIEIFFGPFLFQTDLTHWSPASRIISYLALYLSVILLWTATFFRLKEKEY